MRSLQKLLRQFTPAQTLLAGFIIIILTGTFLLTLPMASSQGVSQPFIDALFTATSAVSTTGLVVVDTGSFYSRFGQIVIIILIQIGGLGYMIFIVSIAYIFGKKLSFRASMLLEDSLAGISLGNIKKIVASVIWFTILFEFVGAAILSRFWMREFSVSRSIYLGIFHSISAFCTAGFGLFSDSFSSYQKNILINLTLDIVCIAGGIGFFVLHDLHTLFDKTIHQTRPRLLSLHSKLVLAVSILVMAIGTGVIFVSEGKNLHLGDRLITSTFQSISASTTTGFNTIDIGAMSNTSLFTIIVLMFIGASPGGTGGGIKSTTFGAMLLFLLSILTGRNDVNIFKNRLSSETITKALAIGLISILLVILGTAILTAMEKASFIQILFEVVSAFGTVGLSTGITSGLSNGGKIVITIIMLVGRLGPLTMGLSLLGRPKLVRIRYPQERVFVG